MNFNVVILLVTLSILGCYGYGGQRCGKENKYYAYASKQRWVCCGDRLWFKSRPEVTCCLTKGYNPLSQECCGGRVHSKLDINSACCNGKYYQRGVQQCCGRKLIDIKTEGCCRNEPFIKEYETCCNGERVPNLIFDNTVEPTCCKDKLYDPTKYICCANIISPRIAGDDTKCCKSVPYNSKRDVCCKGQIRMDEVIKATECCNNKLINPKQDICCGRTHSQRKWGKDTGCCRMTSWDYVVFDSRSQICCSRKLLPRRSSATSCCGSVAYDVNTAICCDMKVTRRAPGKTERCCGSRVYDRNTKICCDKYMWSIPTSSNGYTFCCGKYRYDRRRFKCLKGNKLSSLKVEAQKSLG